VTIVIIAVVAVLLVLGVGLLVFWLMRRSQQEVPKAADALAARRPQVVGADQQGRPVMDTDEPSEAPRDTGAFENLLQVEIHDLGREQPAADDED
jgi:hypothetical protein